MRNPRALNHDISYKLIGILVQSLNGRWCCVLDYASVEPLTDKQGLRRINKICRNNIYEMRARQTHVCVSMTFMNWHRAAAVQSAVICCLLDCCCWMKVDRVYSPSVASPETTGHILQLYYLYIERPIQVYLCL